MRAFSFLLLLAFAQPVFAVGSNGNTPPTPTETTTACEDGQIFDEDSKKCVDADTQSLNDDQRYRAVRELAYAGQYDRARQVIDTADTPDDPRFLNYRGFIARKEGRWSEAVGFYNAALAANPDYLLARSYLGMGLAAQGDIDGAKEQLTEIRTRGGKGGWPYIALKHAINEGPANAY